MSHPELQFFNSLCGTLEIELTDAREQLGELLNERATPEAQIKSLKLVPRVFVEATSDFRDLTHEERQAVAFRGAQITLRGESGDEVSHSAPNGKHFTVQQLLDAVEETERQSRGQTEWFGGVDVHHAFFEGIEDTGDGVWEICWGS